MISFNKPSISIPSGIVCPEARAPKDVPLSVYDFDDFDLINFVSPLLLIYASSSVSLVTTKSLASTVPACFADSIFAFFPVANFTLLSTAILFTSLIFFIIKKNEILISLFKTQLFQTNLLYQKNRHLQYQRSFLLVVR